MNFEVMKMEREVCSSIKVLFSYIFIQPNVNILELKKKQLLTFYIIQQ